MSYTIQQTVNYSQCFCDYLPLSSQTGNEPALSIANMILRFMLNPPFTWPTNRAEDSSTSTVAGTQDYTVAIANFGFLEAVTLKNAGPPATYYEVPHIYNSTALGVSQEQTARPNACGVKTITPGTNVAIRFLGPPDAIYTATLTYQMAPFLFTALTQDWFTNGNIPDSQMDIYNNLFVAEALQVSDDPSRAGPYRQRGMAALIAKAEGLSEQTKTMLIQQALFNDLATIRATLQTQLAQQARTV